MGLAARLGRLLGTLCIWGRFSGGGSVAQGTRSAAFEEVCVDKVDVFAARRSDDEAAKIGDGAEDTEEKADGESGCNEEKTADA